MNIPPHLLNGWVGPTLNPWDSGPAVADLQELLRSHGFDLRIDGDFGSITEAAVKMHQRQHGLVMDGIVGPKTWKSLQSTICPCARDLKKGHSGADVFELQGLLQIQGYSIQRDGIFGDQTEQAVLAFQRRHKLIDNGIVIRTTWRLLGERVPFPSPPKQTGWYFNARKWW